MKAGSLVMGMMFWVAAGSARADGGLAGLDGVMNGTGRVGGLSPRSDGPIVSPSIPDGQARRVTPATASGRARRDDEMLAQRTADVSQQEVQQTEAPVAACRIEVARRRRVAPAELAAGSVIVRFTVEPSGRVRDAEAVAAINTDLEVAACAKRVVSDWRFAKHTAGDIKVEHMYRLTGMRVMGHADRSLVAASR